jgi:hypothetical protein
MLTDSSAKHSSNCRNGSLIFSNPEQFGNHSKREVNLWRIQAVYMQLPIALLLVLRQYSIKTWFLKGLCSCPVTDCWSHLLCRHFSVIGHLNNTGKPSYSCSAIVSRSAKTTSTKKRQKSVFCYGCTNLLSSIFACITSTQFVLCIP